MAIILQSSYLHTGINHETLKMLPENIIIVFFFVFFVGINIRSFNHTDGFLLHFYRVEMGWQQEKEQKQKREKKG